MSLSLSISSHILVMEAPKLGPRVKAFESFSSLNASTLGFRDSVTFLLLHPLITVKYYFCSNASLISIFVTQGTEDVVTEVASSGLLMD